MAKDFELLQESKESGDSSTVEALVVVEIETVLNTVLICVQCQFKLEMFYFIAINYLSTVTVLPVEYDHSMHRKSMNFHTNDHKKVVFIMAVVSYGFTSQTHYECVEH